MTTSEPGATLDAALVANDLTLMDERLSAVVTEAVFRPMPSND